MGARWLMTASAAVMATIGLGATFAPAEILVAVGSTADGYPVLLVQLVAAGALVYLGFAVWFGWILFRSPVR